MSRKIDQDVFESIHSLMHLYRAKMYQVLRNTTLDLSHMEHKVLGFFARNPGATLSDLAEHSGRDKAQLTRLIRVLKDKGLIEESTDSKDRRKVLLNLSADGKTVHEILQKENVAVCQDAVSSLSDEECTTLITLLDKVKTNLATNSIPKDLSDS